MNRVARAESILVPQGQRQWANRTLVASLAYVVLYLLLDWASYVQPVLKLGITPWNPQAGLTLAFLVVFGVRFLPLTALAALLSEVLVRGNAVTAPLILASSAWIAIGYGVLALCLRRWDLAAPLRTPMAAARFAAASVCATLVIAAGYTALVTAARAISISDAASTIAVFWVGDINGILTLTPLLLYATAWREGLQAVRPRMLEVVAQFGSVLLTLWFMFGYLGTDQLRVVYPVFVPVIWIALRWGLPGAMLSTLTIQIALVIAAQDATRTPPFVDLQFLMLTLNLTALMLGAAITERTGVLRRVARSESEQRALLAMSPDAVLAIDPTGEVRIANPAAIRLFGETARVHQGTRLSALLPGLDLEEAPEGRATLEGRQGNGKTFPAEVAWARLDVPETEGFLVTVRDATDRLNAEIQLRERDTALARAMRFAVAGELASALAHELNQPITALVSYLRATEILAAPFGAQDPRLKTTLGKAAQEAIRASEVLRRLRDFYRGGGRKQETIHIPSTTSSTALAFQERLRRANVQLVVNVPDDLPHVPGDGIQLEIVLHNLLANAIDAMTQVPVSSRQIELSAGVVDGEVLLRVRDRGPGIAEEIRKHLFEPFTTSKSDGMGLGLTISRSLIRTGGGDLVLESSSPGEGTVFVIHVPIKARQSKPS